MISFSEWKHNLQTSMKENRETNFGLGEYDTGIFIFGLLALIVFVLWRLIQ